MNPKRQPIRDPGHLKFITTLPCLICDQEPSDPHHLKALTDGGMGIKPSDSFAVPLCRQHHSELHQKGERTFFNRKMADIRELTVDLYCDSDKREKCLGHIEKWRGSR